MNETNIFYLKENIHPESNDVEVYFCDSGYAPLFQSNLNKNNFYFFGEDFSIGDIKNINIDIKIDNTKNVRIWSNRKNVSEYLNLLYFCYKYEGKNISVVFTDDYLKYCRSIGECTSEEVLELLKYERKLTTNEIEKYKEEWLRLVNENSELRVFENKQIISVNYEYLDDYILKRIDKNNMNKTIGHLMADDENNSFSDSIYRLLVKEFINKRNRSYL